MLCLYPSMLAECSFVLLTLRARIVFSNSSLLRISFLFFPCHTLPQFNKAGLLAWVHTCYFYLRVAGRVGPPPHLSLFTPGWGCAPLAASSVTVQGVSLPSSLHCSLLGCVAATLIPLLILLGCVAATLIPLRILLKCVAATLIALLSFGCVAATLIALLSFGCVAATLIACTLWGVLLPPLFYPRVHPTTFSPIYCQRLCILSWTT